MGAHRRGARRRGALDPRRGHAPRAARVARPAAREGAAEEPGRAPSAELRGRRAAARDARRATRSGSRQLAKTRRARSTPSGRRSSSCASRRHASRRTSTSSARACRPIAGGSRRSRRCKRPRSASPRSRSIAGSRRRRSTERRRLAQELVVESGWERAVETVLGPYLQAVGIKSIDSVARSLPDLTEGGVTLVEIDGDTAQRRPRRAVRCSRTCKRRRPSRRCSSAFALPNRFRTRSRGATSLPTASRSSRAKALGSAGIGCA